MTPKELGITEELADKAVAKFRDLQVQAIMFDMDIDVETWSLVPKTHDERPQWQKNWQEKRHQMDIDEYFDIGDYDERN